MNTFMKYDPFSEFRVISDGLFKDLFKEVSWNNINKGYPKYDQYNREDGSVVLEFNLAGYKPSELSVTVEDNSLTVRAQRNEEKDERVLKSRTLQSFQKSFTADKNLDLENLKASYEDGLLVVEIPSKEVAKPKVKQIEIATPSKLLK